MKCLRRRRARPTRRPGRAPALWHIIVLKPIMPKTASFARALGIVPVKSNGPERYMSGADDPHASFLGLRGAADTFRTARRGGLWTTTRHGGRQRPRATATGGGRRPSSRRGCSMAPGRGLLARAREPQRGFLPRTACATCGGSPRAKGGRGRETGATYKHVASSCTIVSGRDSAFVDLRVLCEQDHHEKTWRNAYNAADGHNAHTDGHRRKQKKCAGD